MRQRLIFEEGSAEVRLSVSQKVLRRTSCNNPVRLVSLQVPDDPTELESDIRALLAELVSLQIYFVDAAERRPVSADGLVRYTSSDEWWLGDVMFEFGSGDGSEVLFAPYADGALLLVACCQAEGYDMFSDIVECAVALGYEWDGSA